MPAGMPTKRHESINGTCEANWWFGRSETSQRRLLAAARVGKSWHMVTQQFDWPMNGHKLVESNRSIEIQKYNAVLSIKYSRRCDLHVVSENRDLFIMIYIFIMHQTIHTTIKRHVHRLSPRSHHHSSSRLCIHR